MSIACTAWAWGQDDLRAHSKFLLVYLSDFWVGWVDEHEEIKTTANEVCARLGLTADEFFAAFDDLRSRGLLSGDYQWRVSDGGSVLADRVTAFLSFTDPKTAKPRDPNARAPIPEKLRRQVYEHDGYACVACGDTYDLQIDHIQPVSRGGTNERENLQTLCRACNVSKRDKTMSEWMGRNV